MKGLKWLDVIIAYGETPPSIPGDPNLRTKATAKGHIHKVNSTWLPPKGWVSPQVKKRRAKWNKLKEAIHDK